MTTLNLDNVDLGGFGVTDVEKDDSGFTGDEYSLDSHTSSTVGEAFKTDAEQHSKVKQLSRDSGIPAEAVAGDPAAVETNLKLKNIDFSDMSRRTPGTALFLTDFDNAVIAQNDISIMQRVEDTLRSIPGGLVSGFGAGFEGTGRAVEAGGRLATRGVSSILPESFTPYLYQTEETPELLKEINELLDIGQLFRSAGAGMKESGETIADVPAERQNLATDIGAGLGQVSGQIVTSLMSAPLAMGMMFGQGVDQQGERQEESGTEGRDTMSDLALFAGGGTTLVTEKMGLDALMNRIPPKIKNDVLRQVTDIGIAGGIEAVQEVVEGVAQGLIEQFTTNPDAEIFEGLDREAMAAGGVGAIMRAIINAVVPGRMRTAREVEEQHITQGQAEQVTLDKLNTDISSMKMKQYDTETLRKFVEEINTNDQHIFIDSTQASLYLKDKTADEIAAEPALQLMVNSLVEATVTGTDVEVSLEDFAIDIVGTQTYDDLREHMTMNPESVTPFRAEAAREEVNNYIQTMVEEANQNVSQYAEAQEIYETVQQQLVDSGQVTPQNSKVMAEVVPAWAAVYAKKNGISITEAFEKSGLNITGPQTGERARLEGELELLDQSLPDRFAIIDAVKGRTPIEDVITQASSLVGTVEGVYSVDNMGDLNEDNQKAIQGIEDVAVIYTTRPDKMATVWDNTGKGYRVINGNVKELSTDQDPNSDLNQNQGVTLNIFSELFRKARNTDPAEIEAQRVRDLRTKETRRRQERLKDIPAMPADFDQALQELADWSENFEEFQKALNPDMFDISDRNLTRLGRATMSLDPEFETAGDEGTVTIYRALPEGENIEAGDWVSFDEQYAAGHESNVGEEGGTTISIEVPADEVYTPGADENEWVYIPKNTWGDIESIGELWQSLTDGSKPDTYPEVEGGQLFAQDQLSARDQVQPDKNLFVAHNITAEGILAANELGGLAAPSIAVARADVSDFEGFGEITLLADPELLNDPKARTFDADVYTPRQPRATYNVNEDKYKAWRESIEAETEGLNLSIPPLGQLGEESGADGMVRSDAVKYKWLAEQGKAPKLKKRKVPATVKQGAKIEGHEFELRDDPKMIKLAEKHYRAKVDQAKEADPVRGERYEEVYFDDGVLNPNHLLSFIAETRKYAASDKDLGLLRHDISAKFRNEKLRKQFEQDVISDFNNMVDGKTLFKGFTDAGNRKYVEYNMANVLREMTQSLQGGETSFYGAPSVRSAHANEMKTIAQVQARRDQIIPEADLAEMKEDANSIFENALEDLKPFYKFDADSWSYDEDVGTAIMKGGKELRETINLTPESKKIIDDLTEYLSALPSTYFESKVQRAVGFNEFNTAVVPRGMDKAALQVLKDAGLKVKTYNPKEEGSRAEVIAKQNKLLFQKGARGYYDPSNSMIRLTEASDLSTFLHEFAHFMYEMELKAGGDTMQSIHNWFKRNADDVAKEANGYYKRDVTGDLTQMENDQAETKGLDMSKEARMKRAEEMGFDTSTVYYHGTPSATFSAFDYDQFFTKDTGYANKFTTSSSASSSFYGVSDDAPALIPVYLKMNKPFDTRDPEIAKIFNDHYYMKFGEGSQLTDKGLPDWVEARDLAEFLRDEIPEMGFDSVIIDEGVDNNGDRPIAYMPVNPSQIRSVNAAFDPEFKASPELLAQPAYHGTPHKFDRFSLDAIGTGEGAQAYGWGMYFAGKKSIAEYYRDAVSDQSWSTTVESTLTNRVEGMDATSAKLIRKEIENNPTETAEYIYNESLDYAGINSEVMESNKDDVIGAITEAQSLSKSGNIYEVEIPEDSELLDYDAPLNEQSDLVKAAIRKEINRLQPEVDKELEEGKSEVNSNITDGDGKVIYDNLTEDAAWELAESLDTDDWSINTSGGKEPSKNHQLFTILNNLRDDNTTGNEFYQELSDIKGSDKSTSEYLNSIGIKGLQYSDATSRNIVGGTKNYVIWDEQAVTIESVNGELREAERLEQSPELPGFEAGAITPDDVTAYLDNKTTGDTEKDKAIRRAVHEQFARGFETYLMEGKAPSTELRNAFRTFARWLTQIYKSIRGQLNVNIDDEMRQVFDRMLATEEQIEAANARSKYSPMFKDATSAEMSEEEFKAYNDKVEKTKDVETETLRDKLIKEITRTATNQWKEEKQDIIDEQLDVLKNERVYRAIETLKAPKTTDAEAEAKIKKISKDLEGLEKQIIKLQKTNDTVGKFIAKNGGLNREAMAAEGVDPSNFKQRGKVFGKVLFPKTGGMTTDQVAELLNEEGFNGGELTANDALDIIEDMLADDNTFVNPDVDVEIENLDRQIQDLSIERDDTERSVMTANIKMDHATVKEMFGETNTDKRGITSTRIPPKLNGMTAKGQEGIHPDDAAALLGYSSGGEMINDILNTDPIRKVASDNAESIMLERHGDILNDGTIEKEADEAVHNEERGKLILAELKALRRGTNQPALERAAMKTFAEESIARLTYRTIFPAKYRKAEIKAAQEAAAALATGDKVGAANAKARQALNYYLGNAATEAKAKTDKIVTRMARYNKKKVREEIQKADGGHWDQITKILNRFEFRKTASLKSVDVRNVPIIKWMTERIEVEGEALVITNEVLNEVYETHWKNVPYQVLTGINDSVKNIEYVARYANKINTMGEQVEFKKFVNQWTDHMNEVQPDRFKSQRTDVVEGRKSGRWAMAQMTKIPFMASWLDGGERVGMSHDALVQPLTDAYDTEVNLWAEVGKPVMELIEGRDKETIKRHNKKIFIPEIKDRNNDGNLYGHQVLAVALNTGNQENLRKMLLGEGWADPEVDTDISFQNPQLQAVLKHMTKEDWELVQQIWDRMDTLYPALAEVHRKTTGLVPPKVEAQPVVTEFGTFNGGYYPVKYDPNRSPEAQENEDKLNAQTESMFSGSLSIQASVTASATNERTGVYGPIRLSLDVVPNHFQETIHFITHHDAVRQINKLIRNDKVIKTITAKLGPEEYAQLKPWLNDVAKDGREAPTKMFWDSILQKLRFGVTLGAMGFKASTGIIQISGLSNTFGEVGVKPTLQALRSILASENSIKSAWEFASENSKVMNHRVNTMDREIKNAMSKIEGKRGVLAAAQEMSMKHIALIQTYMVDLPTWHAAYIKSMTEHGDEARAYKYADWTVESVQGSGITKDMAQIMRGQSETGRMFTMFMTFFSSLWNLERDLVKGAKSGRYSVTTTGAKMMFFFTLPVLFEMIMRGEFGDEDDEPEDVAQKTLLKVALFPVQSVPFVRDIANGVSGDFGYNMSPLASVLEQGTQAIPKLLQNSFTDEEVTYSQVKGSVKFAGAAAGIPGIGQAFATGEHIYDVIEEGEELTLHQLLFGPKKD